MAITGHDHPIDPERVAHARSRLPGADDVARLTGLLSMMADPVRLRLIYALDVAEEQCVDNLALALDVSEGLRLLRTAAAAQRRPGRHPQTRPRRLQPARPRLPPTAERHVPTAAGHPHPCHRQ